MDDVLMKIKNATETDIDIEELANQPFRNLLREYNCT